jgi:hypothetical protein
MARRVKSKTKEGAPDLGLPTTEDLQIFAKYGNWRESIADRLPKRQSMQKEVQEIALNLPTPITHSPSPNHGITNANTSKSMRVTRSSADQANNATAEAQASAPTKTSLLRTSKAAVNKKVNGKVVKESSKEPVKRTIRARNALNGSKKQKEKSATAAPSLPSKKSKLAASRSSIEPSEHQLQEAELAQDKAKETQKAKKSRAIASSTVSGATGGSNGLRSKKRRREEEEQEVNVEGSAGNGVEISSVVSHRPSFTGFESLEKELKWASEEDSEEARSYEYARVWYSQPSHTEAWKNEGSTHAEVRARTYGEVTMEGMMTLMEELEVGKDDVFVDIGSGLGNLVLWASFVKGAKHSYGTEIQWNRHVAAQGIRDDLALLGKPYWDPHRATFIYCKSSLPSECPSLFGVLAEATIIFCNNVLFPPQVLQDLCTVIYNHANPFATIVFTSDPWPRTSKRSAQRGEAAFSFWKSFEVNNASSWCSKNLSFYFYTHPINSKPPQPHKVLQSLSIQADMWFEDPRPNTNPSANNSASPVSSFTGQPLEANGGHLPISSFKSKGATQKTTKARYVTEQPVIAVPNVSKILAQTHRRAGFDIPRPSTPPTDPSLWIDIPLVLPSSERSSTAPTTSTGTPNSRRRKSIANSAIITQTETQLRNLAGEPISFLVPSREPPLSYKLHLAFSNARKTNANAIRFLPTQ